jgi:hypothetical protein
MIFDGRRERWRSVIISPPSPKPVDKLFTTFVYLPILDIKRAGWPTPEMRGACFRQYEVGIGYNNLAEIMTSSRQAACDNQIEKMPPPIILSTNTVDSKTMGSYTRVDCDWWDTDTIYGRQSHRLIKTQLIEDEQWKQIIENSQKILLGYLRIYCPGSISEK